jgi:hypothetical protein
MTRRSSVAVALGACLVATLFLMPVSAVQDKDAKGSAAKESRIDGTIQSLDKGTKTIVVRLRGKGDTKQVVYADSTKFTFRNKAATIDDVKDGRRVICVGTYNDKNKLIATRVDVRDEEM